jgi:hypothetical protein
LFQIHLNLLVNCGTLAGVMQLRLRRCFTVATLCITLTVVLVLLERALVLLERLMPQLVLEWEAVG